MLSHLDYPDDIKSELESEISYALEAAETKTSEAIEEMQYVLEQYEDIKSHIDDMRGMF